MEIIIRREDDVNYFTEPEILEEHYNEVWQRNLIVYFGVIPSQKGEKSGHIPRNTGKVRKFFQLIRTRNLLIL